LIVTGALPALVTAWCVTDDVGALPVPTRRAAVRSGMIARDCKGIRRARVVVGMVDFLPTPVR
jgi:hypothetical protein